MKIAILGPKGTYSEGAAKKYGQNAEIIPYKSITQVFRSIKEGKENAGIAPMYNKVEGHVNETLDCLWQYNSNAMHLKNANDVRIIDAIALDIAHCIGTMCNASKIEKILSHPQALRQCSRYLDERYPDAERIEAASTAQAAELIVSGKMSNAAAIGSETALSKYELKIVDKNIVQGNKTLFAIISTSKETGPTGNDITSIAIHPEKDEPGFLHGITGIFYGGHINMSMIYSRADGKWGIILYMDIEGHEKESHVASAMDLIRHYLKKKPGELKILGSYKNPMKR